MTTPNEELRKLAEAAIPAMVYEREYKNFEKSITPGCVIALLDQLQSQAERIATLEDDVEYLQEDINAMCNAIPSYHWSGGAAELIAECFAERDTLRAQLVDAELHTKQVERGLVKATAQLAAIAASEPVDVVLTFNYGQLVKAHIADHTLYEVDLSPKPYFQVCWAHGWAGIYSSEDEAAEDCLSLCGHGRSIREIKPGDDGYRNPNAINLIEQRFPVSQLFTRPMPTLDVTELVEALQLFAYALPLDKSTVKTCYAVTNQMRDAAHAALFKYKGGKA